MYEEDHPVYPKLQEIGREITQKVKPKAVVVFSAHWQGEPNAIEINTSELTDLIYECVSPLPPFPLVTHSSIISFYGFPANYYKEKYPNVGSSTVAQTVIDSLTKAGIKTQPTRRGLDHGVWASFKVAFNPDTNPLNVPLVQVSLFATEDAEQHYALGRAVSGLRDQGIAIICSGMAVHNLRDMRFGFGNKMAYAESFDDALKDAVEADPKEREEKMAGLLKRKDARLAHPTFEHLLPIHVGAGAAGDDRGKRLWTLTEGSLSWAQYRFGEVGA
jgi:4,5-DOPA dioxygenase extradiol